MSRIKYFNKRNQKKVQKSRFGKLNLQNNVLHDAHKF